ncbi:MAG: hypothetical protein FJY11_07100, partial [Bacteroidetes bacterium]|nr:hypothetical protein [Bacteroidota bacterium]
MSEENKINQGPERKGDLPGKPRFNTNWIWGLLAIGFIAVNLLYTGKTVKKVNQGELRNMIAARDISRLVVINKDRAEIYLKPEVIEAAKYKDAAPPKSGFASAEKPQFYHPFGTVELFETFIKEAQAEAGYKPDEWLHPDYQTRKSYLGEILGWLLPFGLLIVLWMFLLRRMSGGGGGAGNIFNVGKSRAQIFDKDTNVKINFSDVAGL